MTILRRKPERRSGAAVVLALAMAVGSCSADSESASDKSAQPDGTVPATADFTTSTSTDSTTADTKETLVVAKAEDNGPPSPNSELAVPTELPTNAVDLAEALSQAETRVRDSELDPKTRAAWGGYQQALYRRLGFHPEWLDETLAAVTTEIRPAVELNLEARENLAALLATEKLHDTMPAWNIVEPAPAVELLAYYQEAEAATGIDWEYVAAINLVETRMGRIRGVSTAGAIGPMQFLPTTWAECCEGDPTQPRDAIIGAATYLTHRGGPDDMSKAIWGYNNSDFYVNAVTAYANVMMADENAYFGYHGWGVYFLTTEGLISIPIGYEQPTEVPVTDWLAEHPHTLITG